MACKGLIRQPMARTAVVIFSAVTLAVLSTPAGSFNASPHTLRHMKSQAVGRASTRSISAKVASIETTDETTRLKDLARTVFEEDKRPVLLYDGVCNMCNGFVNLFLDLDKDAMFRFSALQSRTGRALLSVSGRSPDDISSIVLVEANGEAHIQSDALLRMGRLLGGPVGLVLFPGVIVPKFVRDKMYDAVADNRYSFRGKREQCRCSDERYADRFI